MITRQKTKNQKEIKFFSSFIIIACASSRWEISALLSTLLAYNMRAMLCNFHKFFFVCRINSRKMGWKTSGLFVSNFYEICQQTKKLFWCSSRETRKNEDRKAENFGRMFQELSCVSYLAYFFPPVPKKQIWFIYESKNDEKFSDDARKKKNFH